MLGLITSRCRRPFVRSFVRSLLLLVHAERVCCGRKTIGSASRFHRFRYWLGRRSSIPERFLLDLVAHLLVQLACTYIPNTEKQETQEGEREREIAPLKSITRAPTKTRSCRCEKVNGRVVSVAVYQYVLPFIKKGHKGERRGASAVGARESWYSIIRHPSRRLINYVSTLFIFTKDGTRGNSNSNREAMSLLFYRYHPNKAALSVFTNFAIRFFSGATAVSS